MENYNENDPRYSKWKEECARQIYSLTGTSGPFSSPIDLNVRTMRTVEQMPRLKWFNYEKIPVKMKITNSGHTVIISGKWGQDRPYVGEGPLPENGYVFSQLHFHWGEFDDEGSEHTVEGKRCPVEMHVVHFKSSYKTQELALKEKDGIITMVYFFKVQQQPNPKLKNFVNSLEFIRNPHISARIRPEPLSNIVIPFQRDYFLYWGSVNTTTCSHLILWFICRQPIGISTDQVAKFRSVIDVMNGPMMRNYRETQRTNDTVIFHILPSDNVSVTLLPIQQPILHRSPCRDYREKRKSDSSQTSQRKSKQEHTPKLPPGMIPREILVQPSGMNFNQAYIYPGTPGQYLQQTPPIPMFAPLINGGATPNMYGYSPMMFPYPIPPQLPLHGEIINRETASNEIDTSESDMYTERKIKRPKSHKKTNTGNHNTKTIREKTGNTEQKETSSMTGKSNQEPKQGVSSKQNQMSSTMSDKYTQYPYELEKLGITRSDVIGSKGLMFVTPYREMALHNACKEGTLFGTDNSKDQDAYS